MKLSQIVECAPALSALAATKLPAKSAYRVAKAINLIKPELTAYEESRLKLAEQFGVKSEDGTSFQFDADGAASFSKGMADLGNEDVDLKLPTVTPDELGDIEIEPMHLAALDGVLIMEAA